MSEDATPPWPGLKLFLKAEYDEREALPPEGVIERLRVLDALTRLTLDAAGVHRWPEGARVLDAGCGSGLFALAAARARPDAHVLGVDLSRGATAAAQAAAAALALPNARFDDADVEALPYEAGSFDVVLTGFALNLFPDKGRAFAELARVADAEGLVVVAESFSLREEDCVPGPGPTGLRHARFLAREAGLGDAIAAVDLAPLVQDAVAKRVWPWGGLPPRSHAWAIRWRRARI